MKLKKYFGFTLSEVLTALVIIGVIAAITVPSIVANYRRQAALAKIKKAYSMLCNASTKAKADGKDWQYWMESMDFKEDYTLETVTNFAETYLLPYLSYYKTDTSGRSYYIYFNDGTYVKFFYGACIDFAFDINGDKKPNVNGRDIFRFLYCPSIATEWAGQGQVIPYRKTTMKTRTSVLENCKSNGAFCSALLWMDGWEFKDDYPYSI